MGVLMVWSPAKRCLGNPTLTAAKNVLVRSAKIVLDASIWLDRTCPVSLRRPRTPIEWTESRSDASPPVGRERDGD